MFEFGVSQKLIVKYTQHTVLNIQIFQLYTSIPGFLVDKNRHNSITMELHCVCTGNDVGMKRPVCVCQEQDTSEGQLLMYTNSDL